MEPKYPDITVELLGTDGNAMAIVANCVRALREGGVSEEEIAKFRKQALSDNYDNVLITAMQWMNVD